MSRPGIADALIARVRFGSDGLVPCVCQDSATGEFLMLGYQNADALRATLERRRAVFWSRSRARLWEKGETSGMTLVLDRIRLDCDDDAVVLEVTPTGATCHTGARTCIGDDGGGVLAYLAEALAARRSADPTTSYVARLLNGPRAHTARKVGEEATEVLLAEAGSDDLVGEVADLIFHALVLLAHDGIDGREPLRVLARRAAADRYGSPAEGGTR